MSDAASGDGKPPCPDPLNDRHSDQGVSSPGWTPLVLGLAVLVYAADQLTKIWALANLEPGNRREWLGELVQLHLIFTQAQLFRLGPT